jgi:hypothetical protein
MTSTLAVVLGLVIGWAICGLVWWLVATLMTGIPQDPLDFWFVWRWRRQ